MATRREWTNQAQATLKQRGFYASLRRRLPGSGASLGADARKKTKCYTLVRRERVIVGPTTAPYPINHETPISSSDSFAEMNALRDRIASKVQGGNFTVSQPGSWIDTIPGEKVFTYAIRKE